VSSTPHPSTGRHYTRCVACRRLYLPPLGRPAQGRPARTCDPCVAAARDRVIETHVERTFNAAKAAHRSTLNLTEADCWRDCALASAVGEES
jgi:hypothetical protein